MEPEQIITCNPKICLGLVSFQEKKDHERLRRGKDAQPSKLVQSASLPFRCAVTKECRIKGGGAHQTQSRRKPLETDDGWMSGGVTSQPWRCFGRMRSDQVPRCT